MYVFIFVFKVRPLKRNIFTITQIIAIGVLLAFKSYVKISFLFPIILVLLVPLRNYILPKIFTNKELDQVIQGRVAVDEYNFMLLILMY